MDEIKIVDTTLRDGNTSLWAHNMTTGMMHPVLRHMDQAGFDAMGFFVSRPFQESRPRAARQPLGLGALRPEGSQEHPAALSRRPHRRL